MKLTLSWEYTLEINLEIYNKSLKNVLKNIIKDAEKDYVLMIKLNLYKEKKKIMYKDMQYDVIYKVYLHFKLFKIGNNLNFQ